MSYKEITLLRKSGKLDEAYQLALSDLRDYGASDKPCGGYVAEIVPKPLANDT